MNWERWARAAGVGFVVFTVLAFVVGGETPGVDDSAQEVVKYYGDRGQVLASSVLFAVAIGLWIWFAATIANNLRERGQGRVAATIIGAVAAFASLQFVATGLNAVVAHSVARDGEEAIARALFQLTWSLDVVAAVPSALFFVAASVGLLRTQMIPTWLGWAGVGVAGLFALRLTNWASQGFWSPTGSYTFILIPCALLWILATSVILIRTAPAAEA